MADKDEKDGTDPSTTSDAYDAMVPKWDKVTTVLAGTDAMRAAGKQYLPQYDKETDARYAVRLASTVLHNQSCITLDTWVGKPFGEPITLDPPDPPGLEEFLEDVDQEGNELQVFARNWFRTGLAKAFAHVYVDMPRLDETQPRTAADDVERPYWVALDPEQVFFLDAETIDGREVLREVRWLETVCERDGYAERKVQQIRRVFMAPSAPALVGGTPPPETGHVEVFRKRKDKKGKEKWRIVESYTFDLDEVPLVTFYADRQGLLLGKPPLEDLVDKNVEHWQSSSDQRNVLTAARFPMLACSGGTDEQNQVAIGPYKWLFCPDPQGRFYYVEHTGAAINAGRQDLQDLEAQMAAYGAEYLRQRPAGETATARALDAAEATSPLQDATRRFSEALTRALQLTLKWMGAEDQELHAELTTDFAPEPEPARLSALAEARRGRDISRKVYTAELQRYSVLGEEYDADEDALQLEKETLDMFGTVAPPPPGMEGGTPPDEEEETEEEGAAAAA
jgi:Domain of unknown function (DUF4055)